MATYSSILAWRIPWIEKLVGYSPWGLKELDTSERLTLSPTKEIIVFHIYLDSFSSHRTITWDAIITL